ncbi:MAG: NADH-quinone oxidoreductase subunit C [Candidatus Gastranaerophilales bacterium]|nr:NADH-quinone oxidoreductase subunit C [Candidatus Gastranaerophilales bacterium]
MNWLITTNNNPIDISEIPCLDMNTLRQEILDIKKRVVGFFGKKEWNGVKLFVVMADDAKAQLYVSSAFFDNNSPKNYESITPIIPAFHMFEREFYEDFGIEPLNHPWLKPVRDHKKEYPFFEVDGEEVHQVGVGPIHAGVIEPGHFRFMCNGEKVYDLEIRLGYQSRGVEDLMVSSPSNQLAESICGDSVIAYNIAYSRAIEALKNIEISNKAQIIRLIALEMERCAIHIGDLGAIAGDTAYLMGASIFGVTRTLVINTMLELCGSRFGRGLVTVGGVNFDIDETFAAKIVSTLKEVSDTVKRTFATMIKSPTVVSRLERTGVVSNANALDLGLVGMAARASGVELDSRFDFPEQWLDDIENKSIKASGDVYSRTRIRYKEILQSIHIIKQLLKKLPEYKNEPLCVNDSNSNRSNSMVISIVEGWRGEVIHTVMTDENSNLSRYKVKDPSFNNWYGLAMAVRNNGISDFPLCNKSFNLSYCGNDL